MRYIQEITDQALSGGAREQALAVFRTELYTPRELELLNGTSNAALHDHGSAKTIGRIGKAFAQPLAAPGDPQTSSSVMP